MVTLYGGSTEMPHSAVAVCVFSGFMKHLNPSYSFLNECFFDQTFNLNVRCKPRTVDPKRLLETAADLCDCDCSVQRRYHNEVVKVTSSFSAVEQRRVAHY